MQSGTAHQRHRPARPLEYLAGTARAAYHRACMASRGGILWTSDWPGRRRS